MKKIIFFFALTLVISCSDDEDCNQEYEQAFQIELGETVCFSDGRTLEVIDIFDQLCCCLCNCLWEGELMIAVETTDESGTKRSLSFGSTTFDSKDKIFDGYVIKEIDYLYDGQADALPLCEGEYDPKKVELTFELSPV